MTSSTSHRPQRLKVQNFFVSRDGVAAGEDQSLECPFGHVDPGPLTVWAVETASWPNRAEAGGSRGLDDHIVRDFHHNIGAEIMGSHKFSPYRGPWENEDWKGWWGENPPFHTPVFVLTHHTRPSFSLGDTTFHFLDASPPEALRIAQQAADGKDVRLGGGVTTVLEFVAAGLVDELHIAVAPHEIGSGLRLWDSPVDLEDQYLHESALSPSGVEHHFFWR
ncbi:dihydrofolate reductase family protein [Citricoccus nitrophenolicus]|uniref:dihydrofolate reductase family protein n=1 Tax=Citricoccus nitrophenolicus TaxID=863575 RepID=UPI0039B40685